MAVFSQRLLGFISLISILGTQYIYAGCAQNTNVYIQKIIDADLVKYHIPGIEVSILCPGENSPRNFVSGTTTLDEITPVREDHLFQIGSESKSFIATIILQLEAEGFLSIDDPISDYFPNIPSEWQKITIRQMLNHSSGIYNYTDVLDELLKSDKNIDLNKQWSSDELVNLVQGKPLYFQAGTGFHYSNTNYVLAGMIIEKITKQSLESEIKNRLTDPLQLTNTYYLPSSYNEKMMQQMAHGYSDRGTFPDEPRDITSTNTSWANAAGAIVSTSHDMALWFKQLTQGNLFPPLQMKEFTTLIDGTLPNATNPIEYGLGIIHDYELFGEEAWWHSGGTLGYSALMIWLKSSNVIITININHITANRDLYEVSKDLAYFLKN